MKNLRLRVLDINTPKFWFTIFYEPNAYGEAWLRIEFWHPHSWAKWWIHFWLWEEIPDSHNWYVDEPITKRNQDV